MTPCDVCGNDKEYVADVRPMYHTEGIKVVCPKCQKIMDKRLDQIRSLLADVRCEWFKRFLIGLRAKRLKKKQEYIGDMRP